MKSKWISLLLPFSFSLNYVFLINHYLLSMLIISIDENSVCTGEIWVSPFRLWQNLGRSLLEYGQSMDAAPHSKSVWPSPQILYCQRWFLNGPKYVFGKDYVELLDFGKFEGLAKSVCPINGKISAPLKSSTPSDDFWTVQNMCLMLSPIIHDPWFVALHYN